MSPALAVERRWPVWAPRVHAELGVDSMMSPLIYTDEHSFGALSLYCEVDCRFDADDVAVAQALAGHLSVALAAEKQIDQLGLALHNRTIIGQAQGVLMERYGMGADQAFDYLRRISHTPTGRSWLWRPRSRDSADPRRWVGRPEGPLLERLGPEPPGTCG